MKIILHPGVHKSATTSIQSYLRKKYGSIQAKNIWYPMPQNRGPGHAEILLDDLKNWKKDNHMLSKILRISERRDVEKLLLSAEGITLLSDNNLKLLKRIFGKQDIELIITLSSVYKRITSLWQELVKHGLSSDIIESKPLLFSHPSLDKKIILRLINIFKPVKTSILFVSRNKEPDDAIKNYCKAANLEYEDLSVDKKNISLTYMETEIIRQFNYYLEHNYIDNIDLQNNMKKDLSQLMREFYKSDLWKKNQLHHQLVIPEEWNTELYNIASETIEFINNMKNKYNINYYNSAEILYEK